MWVAGPAAGGLLADWGADVVKVETAARRPDASALPAAGRPRPARVARPSTSTTGASGASSIDLARPEGIEVLIGCWPTPTCSSPTSGPRPSSGSGSTPTRCCARLPAAGLRQRERLRPGRARPGPGRLRRRRLLGPQRHRRSLMARGRGAARRRSGMGDHVTAITAVAGILAALLEREQTGRGQLVEISLLRTGIYTRRLGPRIQRPRSASSGRHTGPAPPSSTRCATATGAGDGRWFWLLGVEADRLWPKLCAALDRPDLRDDERYSTAGAVATRGRAGGRCSTRSSPSSTRDELTAAFDREDVWWAPVNTPAEVFADPQAIAAGAFVDVPEGPAGPGPQGGGHPGHLPRRARPAVQAAAGPGRAHRRGPARRRLRPTTSWLICVPRAPSTEVTPQVARVGHLHQVQSVAATRSAVASI